MTSRRAFAFTAAVAVALAGGCEDGSPPPPCVNVPPGGCPDNGADACKDPSCAAVYACDNAQWVLTRTCSRRPSDGGQDAVAPDASTDASTDAPALDAPGGGPGCVDLQLPDCSVATAQACSSGADCCGCRDLYVCESGGWTLWGSCVDGGVVPR
jgi:hypothetical protein